MAKAKEPATRDARLHSRSTLNALYLVKAYASPALALGSAYIAVTFRGLANAGILQSAIQHNHAVQYTPRLPNFFKLGQSKELWSEGAIN